MIFSFSILLVIVVFAAAVYLYLRQEQKKYIPSNKYEGAKDESYQKGKTWIKRFESRLSKSNPALASLINFNHFSLMLITFGLALLVSALSVGAAYGIVFPLITMLLILFSPASLPMFPSGLIAVVTKTYTDSVFGVFPLIIGWLTYFAIFVFGTVIKNRSVFVLIYFTFIVILIMNIVGCSKITPEFLSGIN